MCLHHHLYKHPILRTKWWYFFPIITILRNSREKILLFLKLYCFARWGEAKVTPKWNCARSGGSLRHISSTSSGVLHFQGTIGFPKDTIGFQKLLENGLWKLWKPLLKWQNRIWKPLLKWQNRIYPTICFHLSKKTLLMWIRKTTNFSNNIFSNNYLS